MFCSDPFANAHIFCYQFDPPSIHSRWFVCPSKSNNNNNKIIFESRQWPMAKYNSGDRINIIGGSYKNRGGVYLRPSGRMKAFVAVDGDSRAERGLWLTSIAIAPPTTTPQRSTPHPTSSAAASDSTATVEVSLAQYKELLRDVTAMRAAMEQLEYRLQNLVT
jgi:hypothetical protein